jgi:hypothetical protein
VTTLGILAVLLLCLSMAYVRTPFLSKRWRVVVRSGHRSHSMRVLLVRRFTFADGLSPESWFEVGSVSPSDPDFDEKLIELQFKANEIRRRMEAIS